MKKFFTLLMLLCYSIGSTQGFLINWQDLRDFLFGQAAEIHKEIKKQNTADLNTSTDSDELDGEKTGEYISQTNHPANWTFITAHLLSIAGLYGLARVTTPFKGKFKALADIGWFTAASLTQYLNVWVAVESRKHKGGLDDTAYLYNLLGIPIMFNIAKRIARYQKGEHEADIIFSKLVSGSLITFAGFLTLESTFISE